MPIMSVREIAGAFGAVKVKKSTLKNLASSPRKRKK